MKMDQIDSNEDGYDPNEPDYTNGDFFCRLCLSSMNSESMWSSHIAGKRHIKNAQKYPKGLPREFQEPRGYDDDEDSYERSSKRQRFDDEYGLHDDYPPPKYKDKYYSDGYYKKSPPKDNVPPVKHNIVFDYGHKKKFKDDIPPPQMKKIADIPPSVVRPSSSVVQPVVSVASTSIRQTSNVPSALHELFTNYDIEKSQPEVKDNFFEKINQREMVKEIVSELSKQGIFLNSSGKVDDLKTHSFHDKYDKKKPDILDIFDVHKGKKHFTLDSEKESKKKSSLSKKSSEKSKPILDDLDPDELTPDILDDLLSVHLKSKKDNSSAEIRTKKHYSKEEVDLNDPKIIAKKLESLPTMEFLKITHKILLNLDLKHPEEFKMLVNIVKEAQTVLREKLPSELQAVLNAKLSESNNIQFSAQHVLVSQNQPTSSSIQSNKISVASMPSSSETTFSINPVPTSTSLQVPSAQLSPFPNIPVSLSQNSASNVVFPQNHLPFPYLPTVISPIPTMTPMQMAVTPTPVTNVTPANNSSSGPNLQSSAIENYYRMIFSMYQNSQVVPSNVCVNQQLPAVSKLPLQPPPPPPPPPPFSKEIFDTMAKVGNKVQQSQQKQETSVSTNSQSKQSLEMSDSLKNLDELHKEFKRKQLQTLINDKKNHTFVRNTRWS